jgi:hypothetical protein
MCHALGANAAIGGVRAHALTILDVLVADSDVSGEVIRGRLLEILHGQHHCHSTAFLVDCHRLPLGPIVQRAKMHLGFG